MKYFKISYVVFFSLLSLMNWAQNFKIEDPALAGLRSGIVASMTAALVQKAYMEKAYNSLVIYEDKYLDKIPSSDPKVNIVAGALAAKLGQLQSIVANIHSNLLLKPPMPLLANIRSELQTEEEYLDDITDEVSDIGILSPRFTGSVGSSMNYLMKSYLRAKNVEAKLLELEYRTNNLDVLKNLLRL